MPISIPSPSVCVVGDLMLDVFTYVQDIAFTDTTESIYRENRVELVAGGSAIHSALAAAKLGSPKVTVVGKLGIDDNNGKWDLAGEKIVTMLEKNRIGTCISGDTKIGTGKVVIIYFDQEFRILVADRGANSTFASADLSENLMSIVSNSDILFVIGYWLTIGEQAKAAVKMMRQASQHGNLVVLDLVPHTIYKFLDNETFLDYTEYVNVLVSEVNTLYRLFPSLGAINKTRYENIAEEICKFYGSVILVPNADSRFAYDRQGIITVEKTGYSLSNKSDWRGFSDRATIALLLEFYTRFQKNAWCRMAR